MSMFHLKITFQKWNRGVMVRTLASLWECPGFKSACWLGLSVWRFHVLAVTAWAQSEDISFLLHLATWWRSGDSELAVGVNGSVDGYLSLCVSPVKICDLSSGSTSSQVDSNRLQIWTEWAQDGWMVYKGAILIKGFNIKLIKKAFPKLDCYTNRCCTGEALKPTKKHWLQLPTVGKMTFILFKFFLTIAFSCRGSALFTDYK